MNHIYNAMSVTFSRSYTLLLHQDVLWAFQNKNSFLLLNADLLKEAWFSPDAILFTLETAQSLPRHLQQMWQQPWLLCDVTKQKK